MKQRFKVSVIIFVLISIVITTNAQKHRLKKLGKITTTNPLRVNKLTVSGCIDSTTMNITGYKLILSGTDRRNRFVSVRCLKSNKLPGTWFKGDRHYDMHFKGIGLYYVWTILIYHNQPKNIVVIQREKGSYKFADEFKGKVP